MIDEIKEKLAEHFFGPKIVRPCDGCASVLDKWLLEKLPDGKWYCELCLKEKENSEEEKM